MKRYVRWVAVICVMCLLCGLCACGGKGIETVDNVIIDTTDMTDVQKAVVITAESMFLRGNRAQYDQTSFTKGASRSVGRRTTATRKVEDFTTQYFGYHDCSSFVFDVYWNALGMDFSEGPTKRNTKWYMSNPHVVYMQTPQESGFSSMTAEQLEEKKQELLKQLQPGDIINYRKPGNSAGHAMLYVGNDTLLHSQGGDYTGAYEKRESKGTYSKDSLNELLLSSGSVRYLFKMHSYAILRPLNAFEGEIPADTVARMGAMRGIMAEKLSSHTYGQTVSLGGEVTFTFHFENKSTAEKTVEITDTVPENTTYVSGADTVDGSTLKWTVTIPADGEKEVSYKVKVTEDTAALGKTIRSESTVSGIAVNCPAITIAKTLTETEQQAIVAAYEAKKSSDLRGLALADAIYQEVLGTKRLSGMTAQEMLDKIYENWNATDWMIKEGNEFADMLVPRLYGGITVVEKTDVGEYRTRLLQKHHFITGDIILADGEAYLFLGDKLIDLDDAAEVEMKSLEWFTGYFMFTVVRPSMGA